MVLLVQSCCGEFLGGAWKGRKTAGDKKDK